ncbi:MAG: hypothetical protein MZU95_10225 [Desulfomicrobium escambiense]|nr:hypothetical protein [Desulfomicrobium escambiense]
MLESDPAAALRQAETGVEVLRHQPEAPSPDWRLLVAVAGLAPNSPQARQNRRYARWGVPGSASMDIRGGGGAKSSRTGSANLTRGKGLKPSARSLPHTGLVRKPSSSQHRQACPPRLGSSPAARPAVSSQRGGRRTRTSRASDRAWGGGRTQPGKVPARTLCRTAARIPSPHPRLVPERLGEVTVVLNEGAAGRSTRRSLFWRGRNRWPRYPCRKA